MKVIGITGGVGCGKTEVLSYIKRKYSCDIILADEVAHKVKEPGEKCYEALVGLLGRAVLAEDGRIDNRRMAEIIFADDEALRSVNALIHPAVKEFILNRIEKASKEGKKDFLFIEAALLIEDGYSKIVDELWYVYAPEDIRRHRLMESRSYSGEKIAAILKSQLSETEYKGHCKVWIDNSGSLPDTCKQIDEKLEEYLWQR